MYLYMLNIFNYYDYLLIINETNLPYTKDGILKFF